MLRNSLWFQIARLPVFQGEGGAGGAGATDPGAGGAGGEGAGAGGAGGASGAGGGEGGAKWWQASEFSPEEQQWLAAKGLTEDDPTKVLPALVRGHRNAEQRIGKGLDAIIDKPAKDQPIGDYLKANAAIFGLPDKEDGYAVKPPENWPKDIPWDAEFEAEARKVAFEKGVPPELHRAYVDLFANKVQNMAKAADEGLAQARAEMMTALQKDWGSQTEARITLARQGLAFAAEKAGIGGEELGAINQLLSEKTGDAGVMKLFHAIGAALSEDSLTGAGKGGGLAMTPAEARAELARFQSPDGDYGKALAANDTAKLAELRGRREFLARIASA